MARSGGNEDLPSRLALVATSVAEPVSKVIAIVGEPIDDGMLADVAWPPSSGLDRDLEELADLGRWTIDPAITTWRASIGREPSADLGRKRLVAIVRRFDFGDQFL